MSLPEPSSFYHFLKVFYNFLRRASGLTGQFLYIAVFFFRNNLHIPRKARGLACHTHPRTEHKRKRYCKQADRGRPEYIQDIPAGKNTGYYNKQKKRYAYNSEYAARNRKKSPAYPGRRPFQIQGRACILISGVLPSAVSIFLPAAAVFIPSAIKGSARRVPVPAAVIQPAGNILHRTAYGV